MIKKLQDNRGFTLIETMIALAFFSVALLGCGALYIKAAQTNTVGNVQSAANFVAKTSLEQYKNFTLEAFDEFVKAKSGGPFVDTATFTETANENGEQDDTGYLSRTVTVTKPTLPAEGFRDIRIEVSWTRASHSADVLVLNGTIRGGGL